MDDWCSVLAPAGELAGDAARALDEDGFVVVPGPVSPDEMPRLTRAYDLAVAAADPADIGIGRTSTRVTDFVNRGPEFDPLYVFGPVLGACCQVIRRPFKLSSLLARTLRPGVAEQDLHVDVQPGADGWPLLGFILMVDEFHPTNGATRFVPGSHSWPQALEAVVADRGADYPGQVLACGCPGSMILFNGSVWHGHTANRSDAPRRSIQGAFIPRDARAATALAGRMRPETLARISPLARHLLALDETARAF
jgi:hypothetical protein